nr:methyltransferase domain-containing protein [Corallococcus exiguus]
MNRTRRCRVKNCSVIFQRVLKVANFRSSNWDFARTFTQLKHDKLVHFQRRHDRHGSGEAPAGTGNTVLLRGNVYELPMKDGVFSGVLNGGSLHLYPDPDLAYREIFRLRRPGGTYVASTFAESPRPLGRLGVSATGIRLRDLPGLPQALARAGIVARSRHGPAPECTDAGPRLSINSKLLMLRHGLQQSSA